jgi:5-methylcytosine-specific restriction endonuclease McrA
MHCSYCDNKMTNEPGKPNSDQVDHIQAYSKGGATNEANGRGACLSCNLSKSSKDLGTEWTPPNEAEPGPE